MKEISPPTYRIRDWSSHFENHESRKIKCLQWVPVKNKHDGSSYRRVAALPDAVEVFCAWSLLVQVASRMPVRGVLRDEDGPLTASELAMKTGFPEQIFTKAFSTLTDKKIRWIEVVDGEISRPIPEHPGASGNFGVEGKGIEVVATATTTSDPSDQSPPSAGGSNYPTLEQALSYAKGAPIIITPEQATSWHERRSEGGWQTNIQGVLTPIADWRSNLHAYVRRWNANEAEKRAKQEERERSRKRKMRTRGVQILVPRPRRAPRDSSLMRSPSRFTGSSSTMPNSGKWILSGRQRLTPRTNYPHPSDLRTSSTDERLSRGNLEASC
jgi:hypothetical protein